MRAVLGIGMHLIGVKGQAVVCVRARRMCTDAKIKEQRTKRCARSSPTAALTQHIAQTSY